jgi:phosphoribosylformimino-5-aminoimidazole carboxamide ribotide isomerase
VRLYPAIDILGGNAVRLVKGDFDARTVYDEDPLAAAQRWADEGAEHLHVVDLDGARRGEPANLEHLMRIAKLGLPVQYGGGLRSRKAIADAIAAGADRVILGTAALNDPALLEQALERHGPERVVVSVDVRGGEVVVEGWTKPADIDIREVFARLIARGVRELAYTNVDRDGMLEGPSLESLTSVAGAAGVLRADNERSDWDPDPHLVYSGGVGSLYDLEHLAKRRSELHLVGLIGVIVGKALYEERFTIGEAQQALAETPSD